MAAGYSPCLRDHAICKSKWHLVISDYHRIADYYVHTCTNREVYWPQSNCEHVQEGLPKTSLKELYDRIDKWYGKKPQIQPPHVKDLINPRVRNFEADREESDDNVKVVDENCGEESIDPLNMPNPSSPVPNARAPMAGRYGRCMSSSLGFASPLAQASAGSPIQGGPIPAPRINPIFMSSSKSKGVQC
jgi:hypothetical protein